MKITKDQTERLLKVSMAVWSQWQNEMLWQGGHRVNEETAFDSFLDLLREISETNKPMEIRYCVTHRIHLTPECACRLANGTCDIRDFKEVERE